jgi:hypothetical protein
MASKVQFKEFLDNNLLPTLVQAYKIGLDEHIGGMSLQSEIMHHLIKAVIHTADLAGMGKERI